MMYFYINVNGDMAFMEAIFTGLGHLYSGNGGMLTVFKVALLANCLMSMLKFIIDPKGGIMTSFWVSLVIYMVLFTPTGTAVLTKDNHANRMIAGQIPIGILYPAEIVSKLGTETAKTFKDVFVATNFGYGGGSIGPGQFLISKYGLDPLIALNTMRQAYTNDAFSKSVVGGPGGTFGNSGASEAISTYFEKCLERYNRLSTINGETPKPLASGMVSSDAWAEYKISADWPIRIRINGVTQNTTCELAHSSIANLIDDRAAEIAMTYLDMSARSQDSDSNYAQQLSNVNDFLTEMNNGGAVAMHQMLENRFVMSTVAGNCGDSVLLSRADLQLCRAQFDQITSRRNVEASKATGFKEMFIPMVTFMEGFVYLITPFILFVVLLLGVKGLSLAGKYLTALVWIVLMPICQVAVDLYLSVYFNKFLTRLQNDSAGTSLISMNSQSSVWTDLESFISFAGTAQAMVPTLAMFILFAGVHTLMGIASGGGNNGASQTSMGGNVAAQSKSGTHVYGNQQATAYNNNGDVTQKVSSAVDSNNKVSSIDTSVAQAHSATVQSLQAETQSAQTARTTAIQEVFSGETANSYGNGYKLAKGMGYSDAASHIIGQQMQNGSSWNDAERFAKTQSKGVNVTAGGGIEITGNVNEILDKAKMLIPGVGQAKGVAHFLEEAGEGLLGDGKDSGGDAVVMKLKVGANGQMSLQSHDASTNTWGKEITSSDTSSDGYSDVQNAMRQTSGEITEARTNLKTDKFTEQEQAAIQANDTYQAAKSRSEASAQMDTTKFGESISIKESAPIAANTSSDFKAIANQKHFEKFNNDLINSFLSSGEKNQLFGHGKEFDIANSTAEQRAQVFNALDANERATLAASGFVKMNENGSFDQMTAGESISKATGKNISDNDIERMSQSSGSKQADNAKRVERAQLLQDTFRGIANMHDTSSVSTHKDELIGASGEWFKSAGSEQMQNGGPLGELRSMGQMMSAITDDNLHKQPSSTSDMQYIDGSSGDQIEKSIDSTFNKSSRFKGLESDPSAVADKLGELQLEARKNNLVTPGLSNEFGRTIAAVKDGTLSGDAMVAAVNNLEGQVDNAKGIANDAKAAGHSMRQGTEDIMKVGNQVIQDAADILPGVSDFLNMGSTGREQFENVKKSEIEGAVDAVAAMDKYQKFMAGAGAITESKGAMDKVSLLDAAANWTPGDTASEKVLKEHLDDQTFKDFKEIKQEALAGANYLANNDNAKNIAASLLNNTSGNDVDELYSRPNRELFNNVVQDMKDGDLSVGSQKAIMDNFNKFNTGVLGNGIERNISSYLNGQTLHAGDIPHVARSFHNEMNLDSLQWDQKSALTNYLQGNASKGDMLNKGFNSEQLKLADDYARVVTKIGEGATNNNVGADIYMKGREHNLTPNFPINGAVDLAQVNIDQKGSVVTTYGTRDGRETNHDLKDVMMNISKLTSMEQISSLIGNEKHYATEVYDDNGKTWKDNPNLTKSEIEKGQQILDSISNPLIKRSYL